MKKLLTLLFVLSLLSMSIAQNEAAPQTKHDEKGNLTERLGYSAEGRFIYQFEYKYDEHGNYIEFSSYNADGSFDYQVKYDEKGNQIEQSFYDADGCLWWKSKYEYDEQSNLIKETASAVLKH